MQRNCDIADAQHGGDYTLCVYLMKMREYFRWEAGLPFNARLPKDEVGEWLTAREGLWESLNRGVRGVGRCRPGWSRTRR